ncbi:MAG: hypothetical protein ACOX8B_04870 [Lachnospiraceae bacterium]
MNSSDNEPKKAAEQSGSEPFVSSHSRGERIAAVIGIIVIAAVYVSAMICALIDSPIATSMLAAAIFITIAVPVLIYLFRFCAKLFRRQPDSGASPDGASGADRTGGSGAGAAGSASGNQDSSRKKRS